MKYAINGIWGPLLFGLSAALSFNCSARVRAAEVEVGQSAPAFELPDENGSIHRLADYKGKTLILAFYPKDFTGG